MFHNFANINIFTKLVVRVRDSTAIFKKEISLLIKCNLIIIDNVSRIDDIVGGDHGPGAFRFPMKLLFTMKSSKNIERESSVAYIYVKKIMVVFSRI